MSTLSLTGMAKAPIATRSMSHWGSVGTLGAHTTVGVVVSAPVSTWPGSMRLLSTAHNSYLVQRNPAI